MGKTLNIIIHALGGEIITTNKGIELLKTGASYVMEDLEFYRIWTKNKNGHYEMWAIDYDNEDIQCISDLQTHFDCLEIHYINSDKEQNPQYDLSHLGL